MNPKQSAPTKSTSSMSLDSKSCKDLIAAVTASDYLFSDDQQEVENSSRTAGEVLFPQMKGFENARTSVWNYDAAGMPAAIVKCANAKDISSAMAFAKHNSLKICIHTAGAHSSHAVVDDCVVIDLSLLREVRVDKVARTATVAGGAMIGDVDKATKPHGLALPMGHVHHTGVAGMALNATSGVGYLCRTRGLTVTFLQAATIVMADGTVKQISENENSELLWAIRGAGSNYGIAIEMVFSLTQVALKVFAGDLVKFGKGTGPGKYLCCLNSKATREELVKKWFIFFSQESTPNECSSLLVIAPNGPVVSRISYIPTEKDALQSESEIREHAIEAFKPLAEFGFTLVNSTKMVDYWDGLQKMGEFNPSYYYQKAANMSRIPEDKLSSIIDELCSYAEACPVTNLGSGIIVMPLGGELARMEPGSVPTAEVYSSMKWWFIVITEFPKGPKDIDLRNRCVQWVRDVYKVIEPFASKDEGRQQDYWSEVLGDIYGSAENMDRLKDLKTKYDPSNIFSMNRNIAPKQK
jgi:hypothetical protein